MTALNRRAKRRAVRRLAVLGHARVGVRVEVNHRVAIGAELRVHGLEHRVRQRVVAADHDGHGVGGKCSARGFGQQCVRPRQVAGDHVDVAPVDDAQLLQRIDAGVYARPLARDVDVLGGAHGLRAEARARAVGDALVERRADHHGIGGGDVVARRHERNTAEGADDAVERVVRAVDRVLWPAHRSLISQSFWTSAVVEAEMKQSRSALPISSRARSA